MRRTLTLLLLFPPGLAMASGPSLVEARKGFETKLLNRVTDGPDAAPAAPTSPLFEAVSYRGPVGTLSAWLSTPPQGAPNTKRPAMVWITGGWPIGGILASAWTPQPIENDQSAKAYREAGMVMLYPTFRGTSGNSGFQEVYYGELDDLFAAVDFLAAQPYVDPRRIYVGGHSSGGLMALLAAVAAEKGKLAGVIALGPSDIEGMLPYVAQRVGKPIVDASRKDELRLRDPYAFASSIQVPTLVIEGGDNKSPHLLRFARRNKNPKVQVFFVPETDHFTVVAAVNALLAPRVAEGRLSVSRAELNRLGPQQARAVRRAHDVAVVGEALSMGAPADQPVVARFFLYAYNDRASLETAKARAGKQGFEARPIRSQPRGPDTLFVLGLDMKVELQDFAAVHAASRRAEVIAKGAKAGFDGWTVIRDRVSADPLF